MTSYQQIDIDYEQFPVADLSLDLHWIQLPAAVDRERRKAQREAEEKERAAALPENHKVILVPADPNYSPIEQELWPVVNLTIRKCLEPHPEIFTRVIAAVRQTLAEHRGWSNPFPAPRDYQPKTGAKK